ncbi:harmonin isoform X2 [Lingula anatina]|uniref:Harmonin isoform X2 n=1 Tax=Lingula anatina TaxID=7574 RepID=A0A2R2MSG0_LINAN|nr:harmonin isoform X2 [Lingula anatina]|eukprot:XP_023933200.1 harmonin isoform X2 [Lingula anatina]
MEQQLAKEFNEEVHALIDDLSEREALFQSLREYQHSLDLKQLMEDLRNLVNTPGKMSIYEALRPLIPVKHQLDYERMLPPAVYGKIRVIRLKRRANESLGFAVRGGLEHGIGVYVSHVDPESQAYHQGLRVGDQIVRVNGFTIEQAIHDEVLNLLKAKSQIVLKVRYIGMLPSKDRGDDFVRWQFVDRLDSGKALQHVLEDAYARTYLLDQRDVKLFIHIPVGMGLGCSICSGPPEHPGIFIQSIKQGSLAEEAGLEVGDQIINVNGTSFFGISHGEAVVALKGSRQLEFIIRKGAGADLFRPNSPVLSTEELRERERLLEMKEMAIQREREKIERKEREHKLLETERKRETMERKLREKEARHQDAISRLKQQEQETKKEAEERKKTEEQAKRDQEEKEEEILQTKQEHEESMTKMQEELLTLQEREKQQKERLKEQLTQASSFKLQKPVLMSPASSKTSSQEKTGTPYFDDDAISETDFDPERYFTHEEIEGRQVILLKIRRNGLRDLSFEGGTGTALRGKIIVTHVMEGGIVHMQGGIHKGDQLMMVDGHSLVDVSMDEAMRLVDEAADRVGVHAQLVVAKAGPKEYEDEVMRSGSNSTSEYRQVECYMLDVHVSAQEKAILLLFGFVKTHLSLIYFLSSPWSLMLHLVLQISTKQQPSKNFCFFDTLLISLFLYCTNLTIFQFGF